MKRRPCPDMRRQWEEVQVYILSNIAITESGCWEWQKHKNSLGYGEGGFGGRTWILTRLMYCATQGSFDPQLDICHRCDNPPCVNPLHLWLGSRSQNIQDSVEKGRHHLAESATCKRGHPFAGDNLYVRADGRRVCKTCELAKSRIQHGWPEDLAYTLPKQKKGRVPTGAAIGGGVRILKGPKTHCVNGHPLSGDNLYIVPSDGRRQCRTCKLHVTMRLAAERRAMQPVNGE